jgi:hypothetical protein
MEGDRVEARRRSQMRSFRSVLPLCPWNGSELGGTQTASMVG